MMPGLRPGAFVRCRHAPRNAAFRRQRLAKVRDVGVPGSAARCGRLAVSGQKKSRPSLVGG